MAVLFENFKAFARALMASSLTLPVDLLQQFN
jgi:hypothetical protein